MKLLLDSSVIIDFLRRDDKDITLLSELVKRGETLYISLITHTELYAGKSVWEGRRARDELEVLFSGLKIIPFDTQISKMAGEVRAKYSINLLDAIIAATAIVSDLEVVTFNKKDFEKIKGLKLYPQQTS